MSTLDLIRDALAKGNWSDDTLRRIAERTADGFRVVALCLFVVAISGFPSGRRREPLLPVEITVLGAVFVERALTQYLPVGGGWQQQLAGVIALGGLSLVLLALRLRLFQPIPREAHSA
jgi:lipopolysaccharide export system permease protein